MHALHYFVEQEVAAELRHEMDRESNLKDHFSIALDSSQRFATVCYDDRILKGKVSSQRLPSFNYFESGCTTIASHRGPRTCSIVIPRLKFWVFSLSNPYFLSDCMGFSITFLAVLLTFI